MSVERIKTSVRDIPDFPKKGIVFKDITPVLADPALFKAAVDIFIGRQAIHKANKIAAVESRGFLFAAPMAYKLGLGLIPIRKKGKLPHKTVEATYDLEYGSATLEIHQDAIVPGDRVVLIDDLLATGGTAQAAASLIEQLGGTVAEIDFLIDLSFLNGRDKLKTHTVFAPIIY